MVSGPQNRNNSDAVSIFITSGEKDLYACFQALNPALKSEKWGKRNSCFMAWKA